jgi:hypothetical protein
MEEDHWFLKKLLEFYPAHIEKEDKRFFYAIYGVFQQGRARCHAPRILGIR